MVCFIVNPTAGAGKALARVKEIEEQMTGPFRVLTTRAPMDARALAREAANEGAAAVVAVGGDGTVHEVISGLVDAAGKPGGTAFGVVPCGSGNDFVKSVGIDEGLELAAYFDIIRAGRRRTIDLIRMNEFCFGNIGSVGIDSQIVHTAAKLKKVFGGLSYVAAALYCAMTYPPTRMRIAIDGCEQDGTYTLAAVCNGPIYGGGFHIAPEAKNDDGRITFCLIDRLSRPRTTMLFPTVLTAKHTTLKEVHFTNCKEITIDYEGVQKVNLDGNIYDLRGPLAFSVMPGALSVLC